MRGWVGLGVVGLLVAAVAAGEAAADSTAAGQAAADTTELRVATIAPRGSAWARIMEKGGAAIAAGTDGRARPKYAFGDQGDEREIVRRMSAGELDGAVLTGIGLGLISGDVRVLELPFLFSSDAQLDYVRDRMRARLEQQFRDAGYELLAWGDVGWVHIYANVPLRSRQDLGRTKMWVWQDDPIPRALFKRIGVSAVPLAVPEVRPALEAGRIDAFYTSPLAAVALGWHARIKYATALPVAYAIGAYVVRKEVLDRLGEADRKVVAAAGKAMEAAFVKTVRRDNEKAKKAMARAGVQFVSAPAEMVADFEKEGQAVWTELVGKLYSKDLFDLVLGHRADAPKSRAR